MSKESKPHIGIFGRRNNGKSSIINALTGQETAIVSEQAGTTTDPVKKSLELPGVGASVLIDTAGIDDVGDLGKKRVEKSLKSLETIDAALLVIAENTFGTPEEELIASFKKHQIPFLILHNKSDLSPLSDQLSEMVKSKYDKEIIPFSAHASNSDILLQKLKDIIPETVYQRKSLLSGIINSGDVVLLIAPQDSEAPEGRLILPQVQVIRDILDNEAIAIVTKIAEAETFLKKMNPKPDLVITDSQVFHQVKQFVPAEMPLTGFSIVLASQHGTFYDYLQGTPTIAELQNDDNVLILESCTHHVTCDDIGRHKIPTWMQQFTGKKLNFDVVAGVETIPRPITDYALILQCGGCVLTKKQILGRVTPALGHRIPLSNYGMAIAFMQGIFDRAVRPFLKTD
ncbi:MAG: [FeFe] hydrogenase H-cluster maturation GTPase HydF [Bacteroidales bacterium]|nr:[FeFe] hydrogenase H-cluster maturation GTPase HydF [Bacteroidales bacterium]